MKRLLITLLLFAVGLTAAEPPSANRYIVSVDTTKLTVQQPAAGGNLVQFETASVYCAAAQTATPSWNGTAATATAATIKKAPQTVELPLATAWSGSDVGAGTTGVVYNIPAGGTLLFDMGAITFPRSASGGGKNNFTFATSGTCTISFQWVEKQ